MENDFHLENREDFRINPHVWLQTLLAIAGDKEKKREVVDCVARETGVASEQVEVILSNTINILMNETHSN